MLTRLTDKPKKTLSKSERTIRKEKTVSFVVLFIVTILWMLPVSFRRAMDACALQVVLVRRFGREDFLLAGQLFVVHASSRRTYRIVGFTYRVRFGIFEF